MARLRCAACPCLPMKATPLSVPRMGTSALAVAALGSIRSPEASRVLMAYLLAVTAGRTTLLITP